MEHMSSHPSPEEIAQQQADTILAAVTHVFHLTNAKILADKSFEDEEHAGIFFFYVQSSEGIYGVKARLDESGTLADITTANLNVKNYWELGA